MRRGKMGDAAERLERMGLSLAELEEVLAARREPDRSPLEAYIFGERFVVGDDGWATEARHDPALTPRPSLPTPVGRGRGGALGRLARHARAGAMPMGLAAADRPSPPDPLSRLLRRRRGGATLRRLGATARAIALPVFLTGALSLFGLVRLQPANTLWYQELTLTSDVETGEFGCEPLALDFVGLTHPETGQTTLTYALSGGGTQGFGCPEKDISHVAIPVGTCFNPEVKAAGPVIDESHPGAGNTAWKYDGKNSGSPKLVKWDSKTEDAPLGGKGPFDPGEMEFSITLDRVLNTGDLTEVMAYYKAGGETPDLGLVNVPKCPLPAAIAPLSLEEPGPASLGVVEDVPEEVLPEEEEMEEDVTEEFEEVEQVAPEKPGPAMINDQPQTPKKKPTPTPAPIGIAIHGGR